MVHAQGRRAARAGGYGARYPRHSHSPMPAMHNYYPNRIRRSHSPQRTTTLPTAFLL